MRRFYSIALTGLLGSPAFAGEIAVTIDIPRLDVAEYHRPYVALWLEPEDQSSMTNLSVWYDLKLRNGEGTKWLKDMRQWWRRGGRDLKMPADGVTSATRAPGTHQLAFTEGKAPLDKLKPGKYQIVVEAAREVGGREMLRLPFEWPPKAPQSIKAAGEHELGPVSLEIKP